MKYYNTLIPYKELVHKGIQYSVCRDFDHISRYKGLRQIIHSPTSNTDRFIALETPNPFTTDVEVVYHDVTATEENRLDVIAYNYLGSAAYAWVVAYFNSIEDGFTVREGQRLKIPKTLSSLFSKGEILASVPPLQLNLGTE